VGRVFSASLEEESRSRGPLFAVGSEVYGWDDVVRLARLRSEWASLACQAWTGMAALAELRARGDEIPDEEVEAAARQFRSDRDLLAADELADWLDRHDVTSEDWHAYLLRALARERLPDLGQNVCDDEVQAGIWAEGICSGRLEQLAHELARLAAVSPGTLLEQLDASFDDFCTEALDERAAAREVETNRLEWLRFGYEELVAEDENAALEAALCVRADGESLAAIAERAGLTLLDHERWLDEIEPELGTRFLAATPGAIIGPVAVDGAFVVARVRSKTAPSLEDADVRARADEAVVARAVGRLVADRVVWL
jgi:hypothetical protein